MSPSTPSPRTLAVLALLVVGIACSFALHAAMSDMQVTYTATEISGGDHPHRVADASNSVVDLDECLDGVSESARRPVVRAARNGSFEGNVSSELDIALDDVNATFAVYDGEYYRWNYSTEENTTFSRIRMNPVDAETVLAATSTPYADASPDARTVIDSGSVSGRSVERGVYRHDGAYYAVAPEAEAAIAASILEGFLGYLLTPVGRGYVAVAVGLLALRRRYPTVDRPLTVRRAVAVAALAVPIALAATLVFESGSANRFVRGPVSAFVVSAGVVAGVLIHRRKWLWLLAWTALLAALTVGGGVLAHGPFGGILGGVSLTVGLLAGVVPLAYGVVFAGDDATADSAAHSSQIRNS
ncbi:hypothetical protein [Halopelagius longus]|uniref:Uncharacterized protein n=1 Tax=Halopelagius longus TaxID=1236180 RepID=A0A1H1G6R4_9EURY|nr:hypothetical protein [Halopelagius longus]RDI69809.1 hypothetical protein DWB78_16800 [Halopelagius longus]SDR08881.1 hypothetical protein SAMN05216278_3557 [Halopelagius longus]